MFGASNKMTKYYSDKNRFNMNDPGTPISVGTGWTKPDRPTYVCPYCSRTLQRLTDSKGSSPSWYCSFCSIESKPEDTTLRSQSSIVPQKGEEQNPLASTKFKEPTVGREPIDIKGGMKTLQQKGIKIKYYKEGKG
jgi:hypothetical protein